MKFSYSWLRDFVDCRITPEALAHRLTMAGIEVSSVEASGGDAVFEAEITSNRPDWLSIRGIAREVAAITGKKFKEPSVASLRPGTSGQAAPRISIGNKKECPLYTALIIDGVSVGPSPEWLQKRLAGVGCRSVNLIVDITNYILFEYGQPLHAFDAALLDPGPIAVRRGRPGEKMMSIDGLNHALSADMLVVADARKPIALAGVMGAKTTEVSDKTRTLLLEAAVFNPVLVRKTRQKTGIISESAYRFERGVDPAMLYKARDAAAAMILRMAGGRVLSARAAGGIPRRVRSVVLSAKLVEESLGVSIPAARIKKILTDLGFKCRGAPSRMTVGIPLRRADVEYPQDLIEEVARIYGYEQIPVTFPVIKAALTGVTRHDRVSFIKDLLAAAGLHEAITYSLTSQAALDALNSVCQFPSAAGLMNPLSSEHALLRPTLLPGLIAAAAHNFNQAEDYVSLFEIAAVFCRRAGQIEEELTLGVIQAGGQALLLEGGAVVDHKGFLHLKGVIDLVAARLGVKGLAYAARDDARGFSVLLDKAVIGKLVCVPEQVCAAFGLKNKSLFCAEVSLRALLDAMKQEYRFQPLPRYPGITRDISCVLNDTDSSGQVLAACRQQAGALLTDIRIVDYYKGAQIPSGKRALTVRCLYRSDERTLKESEVEPVHAGICALLKERFGATLR